MEGDKSFNIDWNYRREMTSRLDKNVKILFAVTFILYVVSFFRCILYPGGFWALGWKLRVPFYLIQLFLLLCTNAYKHILCRKQFRWYVFFIFLNILTCLFFRRQSILVSFDAWFSFFLIFYYPFFKYLGLSVKDWEHVLFILFLLLLIGYTLQYVYLDVQLFALETTMEWLQGESRVRIYSDGILYLGTFFSLNKGLTGRKFFLLVFMWACFIIFLKGFRMIYLVLPIVVGLMYLRIKGSQKLWLLIPILVVSILGLLTMGIVQDKVEEVVHRQETQTLEDSDYSRTGCFLYYTQDHFINGFEMFLGSGRTPIYYTFQEMNNAPSEYSKLRSRMALVYHYYTDDWGLIGLTWEAGIPFMIAFFYLFISIIRIRVPIEYQYIRYWEIFSLGVGVTCEVIFYQQNMIYQALVLVILDRILVEQRKKQNEDSFT